MVKHPFWFNEFKEYIDLKNAGVLDEEIKGMVENENVFSCSSPNRAKMQYGVLKRRVNEMKVEYLILFPKLDVTNQQLLNIISIIKNERIFREFMMEVYAQKLIIGQFDISQSDYRSYWQEKQAIVPEVAKWTELTIKRLSSTFRNYLLMGQLIRQTANGDEVVRPLIDSYLKEMLKLNNDLDIIYALTGGD